MPADADKLRNKKTGDNTEPEPMELCSTYDVPIVQHIPVQMVFPMYNMIL